MDRVDPVVSDANPMLESMDGGGITGVGDLEGKISDGEWS